MEVRREITDIFAPFMDEMLRGGPEKIHSIHITGSALTPDFNPKISDINSVVVLHHMDLRFLERLAPLGKKYGRKKISAPLMMTPAYIAQSLDVFPIEFLNLKMLHHPVYGEDPFSGLDIKGADLRRQCERELKARLIGLRQGYLSSAGDPKILSDQFVGTLAGYLPLFRGILLLFGRQPPIPSPEVLNALREETGVDIDVFRQVFSAKQNRTKFSKQRLDTIFETYYRTVERLVEIINAMAD